MTQIEQIEARSYHSQLAKLGTWLRKTCIPYLRNTYLPYVPGTKQFQYRYRRLVAREAMKGLKWFKDLRALDSTTKRCLFFQVRTAENHWSRMIVSGKYTATILGLMFIIAMFIPLASALLSTVTQAYSTIPLVINHVGWSGFTIYMLISFIVLVALPLLCIFGLPRLILWYPRFILPPLLLIIIFPLVFDIYHHISLGRTLPDIVAAIIVKIIFPEEQRIFLIIILSVIIYVLFLAFLIAVVFKRRLRAFHPDAVLIHTLLGALSIVEKHPSRWAELGFRRQLIPMLDEAARCLQYGLNRQGQSGNSSIDVWFQDVTKRKAAALHELKKWVLMPKADTRSHFIARIATSLSQIASGNWDALEEVEPERISRIQMWRSYTVAALGALFIACLPGGAWWALQQTSLALKGASAEYVTLGMFGWAVVTLIMAYDPLFGPKAIALREVVQSLPILGSLLAKDKK